MYISFHMLVKVWQFIWFMRVVQAIWKVSPVLVVSEYMGVNASTQVWKFWPAISKKADRSHCLGFKQWEAEVNHSLKLYQISKWMKPFFPSLKTRKAIFCHEWPGIPAYKWKLTVWSGLRAAKCNSHLPKKQCNLGVYTS